MSLPHIMLTDSQAHLLAELLLAPLPAREGSDGDTEVSEEGIAARGLDLETTLMDLPRLVFLGLVVRETDVARVTVSAWPFTTRDSSVPCRAASGT
ncbi:hypothetical protein LKM28_33965 [Streptomyces sp. CT1-17]|uniref:hypothetical protein n=1 Tax=Streptomyces sp. CT1-17 TaxID=2885642 RepID=UPI001D12BEDA|nr:hypothetical protein [Streptomyces sp. CT1-17]MCC2271278.1 hypothetical protein [Streptomyces sp. CT1-17]